MNNASGQPGLSIGWDVGGWNCDYNRNSRDALVVLDPEQRLLGRPWRGNLRSHINAADDASAFRAAILNLCGVEADSSNMPVTLAIDAPLGFPETLIDLLTQRKCVDAVGRSAENPYLFRDTERRLFSAGLSPLSAIKDMIGSQSSKAIHAVAKFAPVTVSTGVWSDGGCFRMIETYPAACRGRMEPGDLGYDADAESVPDIMDARICALIAHRFRVAAPLTVSNEAIRLAVVNRLAWIKRQRAKFEAQPRQSERCFISGETHFYLDKRYRLNVTDTARAGSVRVRRRTIDLAVRPGSDQRTRERVLQKWYRELLRSCGGPLIERWATSMDLPIPEWGIKRMKTKWGSCNIEARRIWLNLELIKKPPQSLEYIIVHELIHFFERRHSDRFIKLLEKALPHWRIIRDELNAEPLSHEGW